MAHRLGLVKLGRVFNQCLARKRNFINGIPCKRKFMNELSPKLHQEQVTVTFITSEDEHISVQTNAGRDLLDIIRNDPTLESQLDGFGACGGTCSCSTCHVILSRKVYDSIPQIDPDGGETDMLEIVPELSPTSRLGCQVKVTKELDGMIVQLPLQAPQDARNDLAKI